VLCAVGSAQSAEDAFFVRAQDALESLDLAQVRQMLEEVEGDDDFRVELLRGRLRFYEGDYAEAVTLMKQAIERGGAAARAYEPELSLVEATEALTREHVRVRSNDGRFELSYPPGKDAVLVDFTFSAMAAAYEAFGEDFGVRPSEPIRIEVYSSPDDLAKVSSLTESDVATTSTIALSKYNRIMLTSPLALMRGYAWLDTLVHEYCHMIIAQAGGPGVPIWVHEGLAKFSERRWRGGDEQRLLPAQLDYLLYTRAKQGRLVSFAQMHPSIAKLPDQEDASMAYAEVFAAMELVYSKHGMIGLREMLGLIAEGQRAEAAFETVLASSFSDFERSWKAHMLQRERRYEGEEPPDVFEQIAFRKDASVGEDDDVSLIGEEGARRLVYLGDLLLSKQRPKAAAVEYRKAAALIGGSNPVLQARLGRALLEQGESAQAVEVLQSALIEGEHYMTLFVYLGRALNREGRYEEAERALWEAAAINPFDPAIHEEWALSYRARGDAEGERRAKEMVELLAGH
jgi:tetratricopeptide (TPR) repeat protein